MAELPQNEIAPRNHNNPPSELEYLEENLTLRHVSLIRLAEEQVKFAEKIPAAFTEDLEADFTSDYIKRAQEAQKELEKIRKEEKEPFLRQGQFVDSFFNGHKDNLEAAIKKANIPLQAYLVKKAQLEKAERERMAEALRIEQQAALAAATLAAPEQAAQKIEQAADIMQAVRVAESIAAAPIVSLASAGGAVSRASLRSKHEGVIVNVEKLDLQKLRPYMTLPELQKALDRFVKAGGRQCDGADIIENIQVGVR